MNNTGGVFNKDFGLTNGALVRAEKKQARKNIMAISFILLSFVLVGEPI